MLEGENNRQAAELAIHLLAQLPARITASLPASLAESESVGRLGIAYGVADRIISRPSGDPAPDKSAIVIDDRDGKTPAELLTSIDNDALPPAGGPKQAVRSGGELSGHRILVVTNIPIHYRVALFEKLATLLTAEGASFCTVFLAGIPRDRDWIDSSAIGFAHRFVDSYDLGRGRGSGRLLIPRSLHRVFDAIDPTIVLGPGFSPLVSGRLARWCKDSRAFGIWSGEIRSRPTAHSRWRGFQRRRLALRADFGIAYGWASAVYLKSLREDLPIVLGRNSSLTPLPSRRAATGPVELLAVSRAEREKALDLVIDAVLAMPEDTCRLTLVGDGPELPRLKARARASRRVRFLGALPHHAVLDEYRRAQVFVFPSRYDIFGLVLVEAMAAGLAVITSNEHGAVADLAASGSNCIVVRDATAAAWTEAISRVIGDAELRQRLGESASQTIRQRWTLEHAAEAMIAGFRLGAMSLHGEKLS